MRALLWFRGKDLRLRDHAAVVDACKRASEVLPVFVLSPRYFARGGASEAPHRMQYLLAAFGELSAALQALGSRLVLVAGPAHEAIPRLAAQLRMDEVLACASSEPAARARDAAVRDALRVPLRLHEGETLAPPGSIRTGADDMFQVFTPFARALRTRVKIDEPASMPRSLPPMASGTERVISLDLPSLSALGLQENPALLQAGEKAARARLLSFLRRGARYDVDRDRMDLAATSRLSADLRFGTLSVRTAYFQAERYLAHEAPKAYERFVTELLWREFAQHWLWQRPSLLHEPFRREFEGFPYVEDDTAWRAWTEGRTGYPVVDAAARQLRGEGFVHNRARMISASFLTKHLLIHYARGEAHYAKWLVDYDVASNNLGWQWSAGCGCDAQPYFRVFNPVTQGERFDPEGDYVRRWVPELRALPAAHIHAPWLAPADVLRKAKLQLGADYPRPIVEHAAARARFLNVANTHLKRARAR